MNTLYSSIRLLEVSISVLTATMTSSDGSGGGDGDDDGNEAPVSLKKNYHHRFICRLKSYSCIAKDPTHFTSRFHVAIAATAVRRFIVIYVAPAYACLLVRARFPNTLTHKSYNVSADF